MDLIRSALAEGAPYRGFTYGACLRGFLNFVEKGPMPGVGSGEVQKGHIRKYGRSFATKP